MINARPKAVRLSEIRIDGGTQQRKSINQNVVEEYAEAIRCGAKFPPVTLFFDGAQYWLADGFHRFHASKAAELLDILAEVHEGINRDAILYSTGANGTHGIRLSNADKRKAVMILLDDKEWSLWSDHKIAKHCHVTHPFVGKIRKEISAPLVTVTTPTAKIGITRDEEKDAETPENFTPSEESKDEDYDPKQDEEKERNDLLTTLIEENQQLKDQIAVGNLPEPEQTAGEIISELRHELKVLRESYKSVVVMRDSYMRENSEMKNQLARQRKEIEKLKAVK